MTADAYDNRPFLFTVAGLILLFVAGVWFYAFQSERAWDAKMDRLRDDVVASDDLEAINRQLAGGRPLPRAEARRADPTPYYLGMLALAGLGALSLGTAVAVRRPRAAG